MPIKEIKFELSQEYVNKAGLRSWKKFGGTYDLSEGETKESARKELKDFVYESIKKQPEELPEEVIQVTDTKEQPVISTEAKIIAQIYETNDLKVLESFKLLTNKYPSVKAAYDMQEQKLKNKTT